ncbi:MAG TPA: hypothetical protein VHO25_10175 [Polyangiaceae bacterium]|nr:hypothetical protein [Polyangiaceae bacterium]
MKQGSSEPPTSRDEAHADTDEAGCALRCVCGSLIARQVVGGIELKCRRCKRTVVVPLATGEVP